MSDNRTPQGTDILQQVYRTIEARRDADPSTSYSARLLTDGTETIARKLNEESLEVLIAALNESPQRLVSESADVLYHLLVLWADAGITPQRVWDELAARAGTSGLDEKRARKTRNPQQDNSNKGDNDHA